MRIDIGTDCRFCYRVGGVAIHDGRVLVHRAEHDSFFALPGGSCEFGEDATSALSREFREELRPSFLTNALANLPPAPRLITQRPS